MLLQIAQTDSYYKMLQHIFQNVSFAFNTKYCR